MVNFSSWQEHIDFMKSRGNIANVMIVSSEDGALWATSDSERFFLQEYTATITQEDGSEVQETVNEALNLVKYMKGQPVGGQGLRICGRKQQVTRNFIDETHGIKVIYGKIPMGGCCVAHGGKCILIGTFEETKGHSSPECNDTITLMAMYFAKSDWPNGSEAALIASGAGNVSWADHIQKVLIGRGNIAEALIISIADNSILAQHPPNFTLQTYSAEIAQEDGSDKTETVDELKNVKQLLTQKLKTSQGLRMNQVKYQVIRQFDDETSTCYTVYGKKAMGGCALVNAGKVIVVATFDEKLGHTSPGCNDSVAELAKYFKSTL